MKNKQEIINELSRLYRLQEEGKTVRNRINELEEKLCEVCDNELDTTKAHEENKKKRKEINHG